MMVYLRVKEEQGIYWPLHFQGRKFKEFSHHYLQTRTMISKKMKITPFVVFRNAMQNSMVYFKIPNRIVSSCRRKVLSVKGTANANKKKWGEDKRAHYRVLNIRGFYSKWFIKFFLSFSVVFPGCDQCCKRIGRARSLKGNAPFPHS